MKRYVVAWITRRGRADWPHARTIEAENAKEYEWQYSNDGGESWKPLTNAEIWEGNRSNILTFTALKNYDQLQFRCVVSNQDGSVKSQPILLTVLTD